METQDLIALLAVVLGGCAIPMATQWSAAKREAGRDRRQMERDAQRDAFEFARQETQAEEAKWAEVRVVVDEAAVVLNTTLRAFEGSASARALPRGDSMSLYMCWRPNMDDIARCRARLEARLSCSHVLVKRFVSAASKLDRGRSPLVALALARAEAYERGDDFARAQDDLSMVWEIHQEAVICAANFYAAARTLIGPSFERGTNALEARYPCRVPVTGAARRRSTRP